MSGSDFSGGTQSSGSSGFTFDEFMGGGTQSNQDWMNSQEGGGYIGGYTS